MDDINTQPAPIDEDLDISRATPELWAALAAAQGEIENATKNQTNTHLKSKYADLAAVLSEIRGPFSKQGLALSQYPTRDYDHRVMVTTIVSHKGGGLVLSRLRLRPAKEFAHDIGAIITYLRRFAAAAAAGIAQEDEDYGLSEPAGDNMPQQVPPRQHPRNQSPAQRARSGPEKGGRVVDMRRQPELHNGDEGGEPSDGPGISADAPTTAYGADLTQGQRKLLETKAAAAGLDDAALLERFGVITGETINGTLVALRGEQK